MKAEATTTDMSTTATSEIKMHLDSSLIKVQIGYPKGYEKKKLFNDGDIVWTSAEGAATFVEKGIGTIVERTAEEQSAKGPVLTATVSKVSAPASSGAEAEKEKDADVTQTKTIKKH